MTHTINTWKRHGKALSRFEVAEIRQQFTLSLEQYSREHNGAQMPGPERRKLWQTLADAKRGKPKRR
jgi:hypothetical protein